jgi:polar amino acid transport system permease protein
MIRDFSASEILLLLGAARWTIALSMIAFLGGGIGGLAIALLRTADVRPLRYLAVGYVQIFQGTPLLMQLFLVFFGANIVGLAIDAWTAAAIGLTLYASAFLGEIWRGCIEAVPTGQWEAATALGLRRRHVLRLVVLPQAARIAIPPTVGFLVQIVKSTSLASIIGFAELTRVAQQVNNATYAPFLVFGIVSAIYFVLCWPLSLASQRLERRLARHAPGTAV